MALPSQIARPMSISATKFTASRSRRAASSKRLLGWGLLLAVVTGFSWWALSGRGSVAAHAAEVSAEERAQLAAADSLLPKAEPAQPVVAPASAPVTMGAPAVVEKTSLPTLSASNLPASNAATPSLPPPSAGTTNKNNANSGTQALAANPAPNQPFTQAPPAQQPGAAQPGTPPTSSGTSPSLSNSAVSFLVAQGDALIAQGKPIDGRDAYNRALFDSRATEGDRSALRDRLAAIAEAVTFSPRIEPGDTMVEAYSFQSGDRLVKLPYTKDLAVDWRLLARVNRISDPGKMGLNQKLKLIKGPFHAVVTKSAFRMDIYSNVKDTAGNRIYIKSFAVGLGEHGSTPTGAFVVKPKSKLVNPKWVNPRTGEKFNADDPKNPIGERWIGLDGTEKSTELLSGYGIHGTVEPESIGSEKSMGCVRLVDRDVELVYELLFEGASTVEIKP